MKLKDLTTKIGSGSTPRGGKNAYVDSGVMFIRSQNILDLSFSGNGLAYISDDDAYRLRSVKVEYGDVLINITGDSTARVALWNLNAEARVNQHVAIIRADERKVHSRWLQYWLVFPEVKSHLLTLASGGGSRPALTKGMLEDLEIPLPSLAEQRNIASVLGALDDKIAANNRVIAASVAIVQSLYKQTKKVPTSQQFADVAQIFGGSTPSTKVEDFWNGKINWATPTDITALSGPWLLDTDRTITENGLASMSSILHSENSILMTSRATIGEVALAACPVTTNQGFIVLRTDMKSVPWTFAQLRDRVDEFESWANGATFLEISRGTFKALPFNTCSEDDLEEFNSVAWPLLNLAKSVQKENQVLARTRDELLPLLMSGKITVREAEEAVAEVGVDTQKKEEEDVLRS